MTAKSDCTSEGAQVNNVCDLSQGYAFYPSANIPPVPIQVAFGQTCLHQCRCEGTWDLDRAISEHSVNLIRSYRNVRFREDSGEWEDIIFQYGRHSFVCADQTRIVAYAGTDWEAAELVRRFTQSFGKNPRPASGAFHLLNQGPHGVTSERIPLAESNILSPRLFSLQYPEGTTDWHEGFVNTLRTRRQGLAVFEGVPGTGKTSYLRHLAGCLEGTHRFYFILPSSIYMLSGPQSIAFWSGERRLYSKQQFVVILEDSDALLMKRGSDNRDEVNAVLNLCDGFLADFVHFQIICTINCKASEIDEALLRPGRLLSYRVFAKLNYSEAARLAASLGKNLPAERDYTVAEIFAEPSEIERNYPQIGFAA